MEIHHQRIDRDREILRDVIKMFISTGEPVSSRSVARSQRHGVSSATIRNVMADLEDSGLLFQPHASAGRVPTAAGYHLYIDTLMANRSVSANDRAYIERQLNEVLSDVQALMTVVSHLLRDLTHQIGIVVAPTIGETTLQAIHFVDLSGHRILCVLESAGGLIENRIIETQNPLSREELVQISNYLTDNFGGLSLREIRDQLLALMAEEQAQIDELLSNAANLAQKALGVDDLPELLIEGTEAVIAQPELADVLRVRTLLGTFTDKAKVVSMLERIIRSDGTTVIIGDESDLTSELDFSLVATSYGSDKRAMGTLGVFGPSRMEYQRVVPLVDYFGRLVSGALKTGN